MDYTSIIIAIIAAVGGTGLTLWFGRRKTGAETQNLVVSGELMIGDAWAKYAKQQKEDKDELRKEFQEKIGNLQASFNDLGIKFLELQREHNELSVKYQSLTEENNILKKERESREKRITDLEYEVSKLRDQLTKYQTLKVEQIEEAKVEIKNKVEETLEEVKK